MELRCCLNSGSELLFLSTPGGLRHSIGDDHGEQKPERHGGPPSPLCTIPFHIHFLPD